MSGRLDRIGIGRRWRALPRWLRRVAAALAGLILAGLLLDRVFPLPERGRGADFAALVTARDGTPLRAFPDRGQVWRYPVSVDAVSPLYLDALVQYEDRHFWRHPGVNPLSMLRAAWQWIRHGRVVSGASTITMQTARLIAPSSHTGWGKAVQILRALQLELHHSKREILGLYLNYVPMGGVLEGVEAASRGYLGKPSSRLTHAEAALLAVLPQAPSRWRPDRYPERAQAARDKVIRRMHGHWPDAVIADALSEPLLALRLRDPVSAPLLAQRLHAALPGRPRVETTLDADVQRTVELLLADRAHTLPPKISAAALVMDNRDLSVLAYAGSVDFDDTSRFPWVDMVRAERSPGSTLKPFLYGFALDDGLIHSESLLIDAPQSFGGYAPGNFGQAFSGPVSVSEALVRSLNVPAVQVLDQIGSERFVARLQQGGLKLTFPPGAGPNLSVILGGAATSLESLVGLYSGLARHGVSGQPRLTPSQPRRERRLMSPGAAWIVRELLEGGGLTARAVGVRADRHGVAYKTGTSYGFRDAWAVGVNERYTVGVWVGRPDGTPNPGYVGANSAAPLLLQIFNTLPARGPALDQNRPAGVRPAAVCWPLGRLAEVTPPEHCRQTRQAWLLNQTAPPTLPGPGDPPDMLRRWQVDDARLRALPECSDRPLITVEAPRWPALLEPWLSADERPPVWSAACRDRARSDDVLSIVGVNDGETVTHAPGSPPPTVRAGIRGAHSEISWLLDGVLVAVGGAGQSQVFKLESPGPHTITAMDQEGHYARVRVVVR